MIATRSATVALLALLLASCGGGGGGDPPPVVWDELEMDVYSVAARDGFVRSDGIAHAAAGSAAAGDVDDAGNGTCMVMLYSFDTSTLPDEAVIDLASLNVFKAGVVGTPFADLGDLLVDHVEIGAELDPTDYDQHTLEAAIGTLASPFPQDFMAVDVTDQVRADRVAGRRYSEFRVRFAVASDADGESDHVLLNDAENSRGNGIVPLIYLQYRVPQP